MKFLEVKMKRKNGFLFSVAVSLALCAPLFAEGQTKGAPVAELEKLQGAESGLPTALKPEKGMDQMDIDRSALAFFEAGRLCTDLQNKYAEPLGKKAQRYLKASLAYRESPLTRVYLGSSHLIQARDASSVITKVREVDAGLKDVDAAVSAAPDNLTVRAIRVESTIELPEMFKRLDTVSADLQILLGSYAQSPAVFETAFYPVRLFELKARELELRGNAALAQKYRDKAAELAKGTSKKEKSL
jgi:hypothetical protein